MLKRYQRHTLVSTSYILGCEELHPFRHLVAEAQQIVVGEGGRVADDQVQPVTSCERHHKRRSVER